MMSYLFAFLSGVLTCLIAIWIWNLMKEMKEDEAD